MGLKSSLSLPFAKFAMKKLHADTSRAIDIQMNMLKELLASAAQTEFGIDHNFSSINCHEDYCQEVPIRDYEDFSKYTEKMIAGVSNVLWKGVPLYVCKTSGTTSGVKSSPFPKKACLPTSTRREMHFFPISMNQEIRVLSMVK